MTLIYHEWNVAQDGRDRRLFMDITDSTMRTLR